MRDPNERCDCGKVSKCAICRRAYFRSYYAKNKGKYKVWHAKTPRSREELLDTNRRYESRNREKRRAKNRTWYQKNKAYRKQYNREWIAANPELRRIYDLNAKSKRRGGIGTTNRSEWESIVKKQRGRCADCGVKCDLTRDHVIPLARGGTNYAFNIQGLCQPCNSRKNATIKPGTQHSLFDSQDDVA